MNAVVHDALDFFGDQLDALTKDMGDAAEIYSFSLRHLVHHALSDPLWGKFMVQLGVAHPKLIEVLGPRATRDLRIGLQSGRFTIPSMDVAIACTFGSLIAVLHLAVSGPELDHLASRYAASMLRLVGLNLEEAEEVSRRPLPKLAGVSGKV